MAFEPVSLVTGVALGAVPSAANRCWQCRRETWADRVDFFCDILTSAADASSEQWLSEIDPSLDPVQERLRIEKLECAVLGFQSKIDGILESFAHRLGPAHRRKLLHGVNEFSDALSGGQFQVDGRRAESLRAKTSQALASELVVLTRTAMDRAITLHGLYTHLIQLPGPRRSLD